MNMFIKNNLIIILSSIVNIILIILLCTILNNKKTIIIEESTNVLGECEMDENIVFFGDSITDFYELEKYYDGYIVNSGISGDETVSLLNRMDDVYKYNPSKVILLIGINDLRNKKSIDDIADNIRKIIEQMKKNRKNAIIYVESVYPINKDMMAGNSYDLLANVTNDDVKKLNAEIEKICKNLNVKYIDIYNKLIDEQGNLKKEYSLEGLHISDEGYKYITQLLKKEIY